MRASGSEPLAYQWLFNGTTISGATSSNYTRLNVQNSDVGQYAMVITNIGGAVTSRVAQLTIFVGAIAQDLVAHLKFENNLTDSSGRGNSGVEVGAISYVPGKVGSNALRYSSDKDGSFFNYVSLGAPADLNFGASTDFSISFWTSFTNWTGDPAFIANKDWDSGGNTGYVIATAGNGHLQWNLAGPPGGRKDYDGPAGTLPNSGWHHVVMTFDRDGNAVTYLDGVQVNATAISGDQNNVDTPSGLATNIGQDGVGDYTDGNGVGI